nr:hypothetical protein [Tanacetum cinerariifolium]
MSDNDTIDAYAAKLSGIASKSATLGEVMSEHNPIKKFLTKNGNSFKPVPQTTANVDGTSTSTIPGLVTTEEKAQKKNDDAKTLFEAIQTRFGGNGATKKTQRTLLKQMYENFNAPSTESLDSIFNRLQKIRNKADLDTMSMDDLYNNFKIVEQEVKRTVTISSSSGSQNMAFLSSPSSTNEVDTTNIQVSTASKPVSTVCTHDNTQPERCKCLALLSMRARRYFQRTGKKITFNGSDTVGYDKTKVECFNCHKMGHFERKCKSPKNQESRPKNQDSSRKTVNVKDASSKAKVTIDGAGFDWSYMDDDEAPTNMALMVFLDLKDRV